MCPTVAQNGMTEVWKHYLTALNALRERCLSPPRAAGATSCSLGAVVFTFVLPSVHHPSALCSGVSPPIHTPAGRQGWSRVELDHRVQHAVEVAEGKKVGKMQYFHLALCCYSKDFCILSTEESSQHTTHFQSDQSIRE